MPFKAKDKLPKVTKTESKLEAVSTSPVHEAFYIEKSAGTWNLVIAKIQDDKVISRKVKVCENKALSLETFKIQFAQLYYFGQSK